MTSRTCPVLPLALLLAACEAATDTSDPAAVASCGDVDGNGGDTGNVPNILGDWTSTYGVGWDDDCTADDFSSTSEDWIGPFTVSGAIGALTAEFHDDPDQTYQAAIDNNGGFTMTGVREHDAGTIHANFSGLVYAGTSGRDGIDGGVFLGLDANDDNTIDCYGHGFWSANKSGL